MHAMMLLPGVLGHLLLHASVCAVAELVTSATMTHSKLCACQIREANTEQLGALSETLPDTIDAALAKAQRYMAEGQLQEAAHVLELSVAGISTSS